MRLTAASAKPLGGGTGLRGLLNTIVSVSLTCGNPLTKLDLGRLTRLILRCMAAPMHGIGTCMRTRQLVCRGPSIDSRICCGIDAAARGA